VQNQKKVVLKIVREKMGDNIESELMNELEECSQMIKDYPNDAYFYFFRSQIYGQLGEEYELKQLADLKKALELQPNNQEFLDYQKLLNRQEEFFRESSRKLKIFLEENIEKKETK